MTWLLIGILLGLVLGFAYAADKWKKRSDFWEHAYLEKAGNLETLLTGIEETFSDDRVVRVWPRSEQQPEVFH